MTLYPQNHALVWIRNLKDEVDDTFVTTATITGTLRTVKGELLSPPVTFTFTLSPNSSADYYGIVPTGPPLVPGESYLIFVEIDGGASRQGHLEIPATVAKRSA